MFKDSNLLCFKRSDRSLYIIIFVSMMNDVDDTIPLDLPIVFIMAKGRSGTTLLQTMVDAHPETIAPLESRFVVHFYHRYGSITKWTDKIKKQFIKDVQTERKIELIWELDVEMMTKRIMSLPEATKYSLVCKQVYCSVRSIFNKTDKKIIIDKNPIHAILMPLIYEIFPEAKIIHLVRDYRASANSTKELQIVKSMTNIGFHWLLSNTTIEKFKKEFFHESLTLTYESLLLNPKEELTKVCKFLNVNFDPLMINYHEVTLKGIQGYIDRSPTPYIKEIRSSGSALIHKNISRPIDVTLINKWEKNLDKSQVLVLEKICGQFSLKYGYELLNKDINETPKLSFVTKVKGKKLNLYYRLPIWLRELKSKPKLVFLEK